MAKARKESARKTHKPTRDAVSILERRYVEKKPEMSRMVAEELANLQVARKIFDLRNQAGLSQRALAKLVGTTASVICRLEDADYDGHSLTLLTRIAAVLNKRVDIRFLPQRAIPRRA